ncbi:MAG: hypothetical protein WCP74_13390 [Sphingobacteriia bacterium]|jgi:hypothetical protein
MNFVVIIVVYVVALIFIMALNALFLRWVLRVNQMAKTAEKSMLYLKLMAEKMGMTEDEVQEIREKVERKY